MAKEPISGSLGGAGLSLLVATAGGLVALLAEAGSWPMVTLLLGLTAVLAGVAGCASLDTGTVAAAAMAF